MQVESTPDFESPLAIFRRVFRRIHATTASGQSEPLLEVRFRPFLNATANIRFRDGVLRIQATELLASAPIAVLEALFTILLCKLYRLRVPKAMNELYRQHLHGSQFRQQVQQVRQSRGRKVQAPPRGRQYDLDAMFAEINQRHFAGGLARPKLGWSLKDSRTLLGHFDPNHYSITISRFLDSPSVPRYVVEYVLYHEMLHIKHPVRAEGGRRQVHPPEFRAEEKRYPDYKEANKALKELCSKSCLSLF